MWYFGVILVAWATFITYVSFSEMQKSPSVGGAAGIAVFMALIAAIIGSLLMYFAGLPQWILL